MRLRSKLLCLSLNPILPTQQRTRLTTLMYLPRVKTKLRLYSQSCQLVVGRQRLELTLCFRMWLKTQLISLKASYKNDKPTTAPLQR